MVITSKDLELALGTILGKTSETEVKNVIGAYNQELGVKENIRQLCTSFQRGPLSDTCAFLKSISTEYPVSASNLNSKSRTKEEYASDIVNFIDFLKPTQCLVCKTNYVPTGEDYFEEHAKCFVCRRPSHGDCYDNHNINAQIGVLFVCSECLSIKAATELADDVQKQQLVPQTPKTDHPSPQDTNVTTEGGNHNGNEETVQEIQDCPLYLKRMCPHGPSGKHLHMGKQCPYKHRRRCIYFTRYGPSGCRFREKCRFLHPIVCQNSLNLSTCLNDSCTNFHLKGTRRLVNVGREAQIPNHATNEYREPNPSHQRYPAYEDKRESNPRKPIQPWGNNQPTPANKNPAINDTDFLEKYLQQMKADLKSDFNSMIQTTVEQSIHQLIKALQTTDSQKQTAHSNQSPYQTVQHPPQSHAPTKAPESLQPTQPQQVPYQFLQPASSQNHVQSQTHCDNQPVQQLYYSQTYPTLVPAQ